MKRLLEPTGECRNYDFTGTYLTMSILAYYITSYVLILLVYTLIVYGNMLLLFIIHFFLVKLIKLAGDAAIFVFSTSAQTVYICPSTLFFTYPAIL